ncbi:MAG: enoyl-CoA hydratase/isomerase family protein, partial [Syntrophomonadaceae bacterium]|nr:enoyl-CoA hydratase/isomerase family protein [Syntrophomonadaceae bacterium]
RNVAYRMATEDNILVFTFDHNVYNPISTEVLQGLEQAVRRVNSEPDLKGLVLTGAGRIFSSGFELDTFLSWQKVEECVEWFYFQEKVMYDLFTCAKPVVAAVNGHATAAGMIVCMAADYRMVVDNPRIKIGMTEISIGLSISSAEAEIMKFGLGSDKNYRDVMFSGRLMNPAEVVQRGIFDELVEDDNRLLDKAKDVVRRYVDTPGRPFTTLKYLEKRQAAEYILTSHDRFDWQQYATQFFDQSVRDTLARLKASMK